MIESSQNDQVKNDQVKWIKKQEIKLILNFIYQISQKIFKI